jgi:Tfp pilus assembly protein PilF
MRLAIVIAAASLAYGQAADPAYVPLDRAYTALRDRDYDTAIPQFLAAVEASPRRADIRKDLAYTYLKIGEPVLARDQFRRAMELNPEDTGAALEYAFLCNETKQQAEARRVFDRIRRTGNTTAERAFHNIDDPLAAGIERWEHALSLGADNFSTHFELATLAEQRDDLVLAATHFERAWRLLPDRRTVLVDLGRVWKAQGRLEQASAALLAASRGGEPRAAEMAREMLPDRYPFVPEFRSALVLDPGNHELRRELAYLLLRMGRQPEAESEFRILTQNAPEDLLSATQLGFLLYARGERLAAQLLFDRVLAGNDEELANRVRAVLHMPQLLQGRDSNAPMSIDAKVMAERSLKAGYMKDALRYLETAHEADPGDFDVMLKLAWTNNILGRDTVAWRWFELAQHAPDPRIAAEAGRAFRNLRPAMQRFRVSGWIHPVFSSRWHDVFGYGQLKTDLNIGLWFRPYVSVRFIGDMRKTIGALSPLQLSENSFILAAGVATQPWRGIVGWGEAGTAINYVNRSVLPDYRGGISFVRSVRAGGTRWFAATTADALYISRFNHDGLLYSQTRAGYGMWYWNFNFTVDVRREDWANFWETGPGVRVPIAESLYVTFNGLRGRYLLTNPSRPAAFNDFRAGFWYAFTR